jgi:putative SOS response-associated peptidase YedK
MCGRYAFVPTKKQQQTDLAGVEIPPDFHPSYNIAPTHTAYVITADHPGQLQPMIWGLVPHWSQDGANNGKLINARAESIANKPSFRDPVRRRRCLVPANSFYEWRTGPGRRKIPYRILPASGTIFFMAGIWDEWKQGGEVKRTFSIITTTPNLEMSALHDRMPVMLTTPELQKSWLTSGSVETVLPLLLPPENGYLRYYPVTEKLNSPGSDGPDLHEPVEEIPRLF